MTTTQYIQTFANLPVCSQTPTSGSQLITKSYADSTYTGSGLLSSNNTWTGTNAFNTSLPTSTVTPTSGSQLITKTYADSTYGALSSANVWSGAANTFNANPLFPTGATVNYVATCTNAGTGAWTWQAVSGGATIVTVQTTNATPTNLASIATTSNSVITINGYISAANAAYTDACGGKFNATFLNSGGSLAIVDTAWVECNRTSTALFTISSVGTNIVILAIGLASTTYNWKAQYTLTVN